MVIEDTSISKKIFLKRRIKKLGYLKVFGQILFIIYNKLFFHKSKKQIQIIKKTNGLISDLYPTNVFKKVSSINNKETIDILLKYKPDIIGLQELRIRSKYYNELYPYEDPELLHTFQIYDIITLYTI